MVLQKILAKVDMEKYLKKGLKFAKTSVKQILEKSAQATGDVNGNKIADKITSLGNKLEEQPEQQQNKKKLLFHQKEDNKLLMI